MAFISPVTSAITSLLTTPGRPFLISTCRTYERSRRHNVAVRMSSGDGGGASAKTETEWREILTAKQYHILRQKGTEPAGSGEYDSFYPTEGHFVCAACGNPLYSARAKFSSGCGWPAFDRCYKNAVSIKTDDSWGMRRVEIMCAKCDGHLGHVFEGERMTDTNERHCVNSISVKFQKASLEGEEEKVL